MQIQILVVERLLDFEFVILTVMIVVQRMFGIEIQTSRKLVSL